MDRSLHESEFGQAPRKGRNTMVMDKTAQTELGGTAQANTAQIVARAQHALASSPHVALRRLRVEGDNDRLFISGTVSTFYQKQQAQETVRAAANKWMVVNEVTVG